MKTAKQASFRSDGQRKSKFSSRKQGKQDKALTRKGMSSSDNVNELIEAIRRGQMQKVQRLAPSDRVDVNSTLRE